MTIGQSYTEGPYDYTLKDEMLVEWNTDAEVVKSLLPPILSMGQGGARGWLRTARRKTTSFGPYTGATIGVYAEHDGVPVRYLLSGVKNDWKGVIAGREIWGMPLSLGTVDMEWQGSVLATRVFGHAGQKLASVNLQTTTRKLTPSKSLEARYSVQERDFEGNLGKHLLLKAAKIFDAEGVERWEAQATLRLGQGTAIDDWSVLPVLGDVYAEYRTGGKSQLPYAEVVGRW